MRRRDLTMLLGSPGRLWCVGSDRPDGVLVLVDALVVHHIRQIAEFAVRDRLAVASSFGGLTR